MYGRICSLLGIKPTSPSLKDGRLYLDRGPTVPVDGSKGYGTGCLFQKTNGGAGTSFYVNEGTASSSDFNPLVGAIASSITTLMLAAGILSADAAGRAKMADGFFTEAAATAKFAALAITTGLLKAGILSADVAGRALMATGFFTEAKATDAFAAGAIATGILKDANVTTAKLAAGAIVGTKLAATGITAGSFTGHNNVGACTLTGATVGQRVLVLFEIDTSSTTVGEQSRFEATITIADQIQQSSVSDLSAKKYAVILLPVAA